jgi:hypothetical protein
MNAASRGDIALESDRTTYVAGENQHLGGRDPEMDRTA